MLKRQATNMTRQKTNLAIHPKSRPTNREREINDRQITNGYGTQFVINSANDLISQWYYQNIDNAIQKKKKKKLFSVLFYKTMQ